MNAVKVGLIVLTLHPEGVGLWFC